MKKILSTCLFFGLVLAASPAIGAEDKPAFFAADLHLPIDQSRVFSVGDDAGTNFSQLGVWSEGKICSSTKDPQCDLSKAKAPSPSNPGVRAEPMLAVCALQSSNDCIESIEIKRANSEYTKLVFEKYMPRTPFQDVDGKEFSSDYSVNLPAGGAASIWQEFTNGQASGVKYLVSYQYAMYYDPAFKKFILQNVRLGIKPVREISESKWSALWFSDGSSGIQYDFPEGVELRATIHMTNEAAGWFKARIESPEIKISPLTERNNRVIVEGKPVTVPTFAYQRNITDMTADEKKYTSANKGVIFVEPGQPQIFGYIEMARKVVSDVAAYSNTYWTLNSTPWDNANPCLQDSSRVLGIVSTNAMGYEGASPKFENGFLNYKVTGLHFGADGKTPNLGMYDLLLRSDAARCLYGFSNAPISATVAISGADGATNVATTVVSEKDGWIKMKAYGFTFSEKNIKVKFNQAGVKKSTITCFKGKTTKKVTAIKPTCPAGYKKK
jgi:hypothetical protein